MRRIIVLLVLLASCLLSAKNVHAQYLIYDDKMALEVYGKAFSSLSKEELIALIGEKETDAYKRAAAVNVLREKFLAGLGPKERIEIQDLLRKTFRSSGSSFIRIEIAYALCRIDRDKYFRDMFSFLLRRIDNENSVISERAFDRAKKILAEGNKSASEARVVLSTLRNVSHRFEAENDAELDLRARQKLELIAWANKVLNK